MFLCGTQNIFSMASLEEPFEAPLFLREKMYLIPRWFCTFAHWEINDQSIIFMVDLFE